MSKMILTRKDNYSPSRLGVVCPDCDLVIGLESHHDSVQHDCLNESGTPPPHPLTPPDDDQCHPSLQRGALHVVASSQDTDDIWTNRGAIAHETMLGKSTLMDMVERSKRLRKYGQLGIFRLEYVGSVEECEAIIRAEMPF